MKKFSFLSIYLVLGIICNSQTISQRLVKAFKEFEADSQLKHAIISLYVVDAVNGKVVFEKNPRVGLAPASTQKIITATTAFELLGKDYRYKTELGHDGKINDGVVEGNLLLIGNGDPTFGSWRWEQTKPQAVIKEFVQAVKQNNIRSFRDAYNYGVLHFDDQFIPDGWIWQDVGNYYGAGHAAFNWHENQFDLLLRSGFGIGGLVDVVKTEPALNIYKVRSDARAAAAGTGDNAYVYLPFQGGNTMVVRGTIPIAQNNFRISATIPDPVNEFFVTFKDSLAANKIDFGFGQQKYVAYINGEELRRSSATTIFHTHYSPALDSVIYWFLQKSINLYGEALVKTMAFEKYRFGSTDSGLAMIKRFWKLNGVVPHELNMYDGSGLSPLNRVTTHAQVTILQYAKTRNWFRYFYDALPTYNGMKMKSGSINDVKGYCGYHKAADGKEYIFSFLINNYNGRSSTVVNKMFKVLDVLK